MDIRTLIPAEDVLTSEMENIFGGGEPVKVECHNNGIVHLPPARND